MKKLHSQISKYARTTSLTALALLATTTFAAAGGSGGSWEGLYVGGYVGAGTITRELSTPVFGNPKFNGLGGDGLTGGGMLGYNFQLTPKVVLGVQGELGYSDMDAELKVNPIFSASVGPGLTAAISGRAGYVTSPDTLLYLIAGYSYAKYKAKASFGRGTFSVKQGYHGFHVGAGGETKLTDRLSARIEYRYTQYGSEDWGTGGFLKTQPSSHVGRIGVAYNLYSLTGDQNVTPVADLDPPVSNNWTGFYAGVFFGGGGSINRLTSPFLPGASLNGIGGEGALGGGMLGYNHQVTPNVVLGLQGEAGYSDIKTTLNVPGIATASLKTGFKASISGRAGYLTSPDTMLYGIAGVSFVKHKLRINIPVIPAAFRASKNLTGFHAGAGIETRLTNKLTGRVEYRYTRFGSTSALAAGFVKNRLSTHAGTVGIAWNFGNLL